MLTRYIILQLTSLLLSLFLTVPGYTDPVSHYESSELEIGLMPRSPLQVAAFYEARGFSKPMVEKLKQQCFITVWIHNKSKKVIWLDLAQWQFINSFDKLIRRDRYYWKDAWNKMQIPLAHQSTFRWTLLPELLDFQPEEREGGNIVLPRDGRSIQIQAIFPTGADKSGTPISIVFKNIKCAEDS